MFLSSLFKDAVNRRECTVSERDKWKSMEHQWGGNDRREQKYSEKNLLRYQFVHQKFYMDRSGI
jgi:hypothetical protein